ncbi:phosphonate metabolism transcriptional regulator PhnF [Piscinibacter sp. XHJ-5]|uniref:phosphonate metabolism transcriptional regulator PhnF n=1 Tax=Piscinibacter sp. XHJ-5 TaxID=3037797 RepID=UPI002452BA6F|nr:phosphonate metabolism transcriptional regulator PhnF [Piscinibacter sp. XHJ-5]
MLKDTTPFIAADATDSLSRWEAIAAALRDDIVQGRFLPGQRLPNELLLAQRFRVNRHTLRQAMQALAREGHVQVRQGLGTFVRELVLDYALQRRTRLSENLASVGERAQRELLAHEQQPAHEWAAALRVSARSRIECVRTRATVRGRPVGLTTAAFPCPRLAGIAETIARRGSVTAALAERGVADYTRARSAVSARLPSAAEADALARAASQPVLVVQYVNVDGAGVPVEAGITLFAADAVQLTVEPEGFAA